MTRTAQKFQIPLVSIILLSLILSFAIAPLALATSHTTPTTPKTGDPLSILQGAGSAAVGVVGSTMLWGLNVVLTATGIFVARLAVIGASFFNFIIYYSLYQFASALAPIKIGWEISRDIANIFFILVILVIAIATILRIQSHAAKALLPRLIVIALFINFSLTIGLFVVDFSNMLGKGFHDKLTEKNDIASLIMQGTAFNSIFNIVEASKNSNSLTSWVLPGILGGVAGGCAAGLTLGPLGCVASGVIGVFVGAAGGLASWWNWGKTEEFKDAANYFYGITTVNVISIIIVFVFIFGGLLLAIRFAMLALLLALAPLAFVSYILPVTERRIWSVWWEKFLAHAFFMPAFMILLYISMAFSNAFALASIQGGVANPGFFIGLFMLTIMLIASLLIARHMGVEFAGAVLGWATASRKWLTGAVGAVAARYTTGAVGAAIAPRAAQLQARFPVLGTAPTAFASWLRGLGGAEKRAEAMADFAKKLTPDRQARYYSGLNNQEKRALLGKMTPAEQQEMMKFMTPEDRRAAETFLKRQVPPTAAAAYDAEGWKRMTAQQQQAQMIRWLNTNNLNSAEQALRGMSDEEKAALVDTLPPPLAASAENLMRSRFSPKDYQNFKVARVMRKSEDEQRKAYLDANDDDKEALLRKMKDDEARARFVAGFRKAPSTATAATLTPAQHAAWNAGAADSTEKLIQTRFSAGEYRAYREAAVKRVSQKAAKDLDVDAEAMSDEDLDILTKVGDENKVAGVINRFSAGTAAQKDVTKKLGQNVSKRNLQTKYATLLSPRAYVETIEQKTYADPGVNPTQYGEYQMALASHLARVDSKALRKNLSPEIIKQKEFVEDMLSGATMEDISLITGDTRRAAAFREGFERVIGPKATAQERAQALAAEMQRRGNNAALRELRDYLAGVSPYQDVITNILEGKPPPTTPPKTP